MKYNSIFKILLAGFFITVSLKLTSTPIAAAPVHEDFGQETQISENEIKEESAFITINEQNFPDAVFRKYLSDNFDTDNDGQILDSLVYEINIDGEAQSQYANLKNVKGIEILVYLERVTITNTKLEQIDISSNRYLRYMDVSKNRLISIDLRNTTAPTCICEGNIWEVEKDFIDLSTLSGFDVSKTSNWENALISGNIVFALDENKPIKYNYSVLDNGLIKEFSISLKRKREKKYIEINEQNFPDAVFRKYLESIDTDHDNKLDINHIYTIDLSNSAKGIRTLKGIEKFPYLTCVYIYGTEIVELDLSKNVFITNIDCIANEKMKHIDVSGCTELIDMDCYGNALEGLDVTHNLKLEALSCKTNQIKYLDVSNNRQLAFLRCEENQLTCLDISNNLLLKLNNITLFNCMENKLRYQGISLNLASLQGFQMERASDWENAAIVNGILTPIDASLDVSYTYDIGRNVKRTFKIHFYGQQESDNPNENDKIPDGVNTWIGKTGTEGFVYRLYNVAMGREADEAGFNDWNKKLKTKEQTAAKVAWGFIFSEEFRAYHYNDIQFVKILYRTMFGREADEEGLKDWVSQLENGMSREYVYRGFAESVEFSNLCTAYGVERGGVTLSAYRDRNVGVTGFIARLYTKMLGRSFDEEGLEYWCEKYLTGENTIEEIATVGFLKSEELRQQNLSNEEFVIRMYETFLNREPEAAGLADWVGRLETGKISRDKLVYGFTGSREFSNIKEAYGL